jgi:hypothetical protein
MTPNDGSTAAPRLRIDLNLGNVEGLPTWSTGPRGAMEDVLRAARDAGYDGIQGGDPALARRLGLGCTASGRIDTPDQADARIRAWRDEGWDLATVHVGWGDEDDAGMDALAQAILAASRAYRLPVFVETHRATVTQDTWRTIAWIRRNPDLRFNADYSHWYTGLEMRYGDWDRRLAGIAPIFERVGYFHGRCGNTSHIQVALDDPSMTGALADFRMLWTRSMAGFLRRAGPGDWLGFAPELLSPMYNYARTFPGPDGVRREESDRWAEALRLVAVAKECFATAQAGQV